MSAPIYLSKRESVIEPIYLGYIFPFTQRLHVNSCSVSHIARLRDPSTFFEESGSCTQLRINLRMNETWRKARFELLSGETKLYEANSLPES